jgi:hypothetical protein
MPSDKARPGKERERRIRGRRGNEDIKLDERFL